MRDRRTGGALRRAASVLVFLCALIATAAQAYNGNVPWMMWDCMIRQCKGEFDRCNGISKIAVKHLKNEGFGLCEKARARLESRLEAPDITDVERNWVANELQFIAARERFLQDLMDTTLYWRQEIFGKEGYGVLAQSLAEIRYLYDLNLTPLLLERQAASAEFERLDFDQARRLLGQALDLRRAGLASIQARIAELEAGRIPTGDGVPSPADTPEKDDDELPWPGDPQARAEYLEFHLNGYGAHLAALECEVQASSDPERLLRIAAFFAAREQIGGNGFESRHREPDIVDNMPQSQFYRLKAISACKLRASEDAAGSARWGDLAAQIEAGTETAREMQAPDWYLATVYEPGWYAFPMEPWQESDEDSR